MYQFFFNWEKDTSITIATNANSKITAAASWLEIENGQTPFEFSIDPFVKAAREKLENAEGFIPKALNLFRTQARKNLAL